MKERRRGEEGKEEKKGGEVVDVRPTYTVSPYLRQDEVGLT